MCTIKGCYFCKVEELIIFQIIRSIDMSAHKMNDNDIGFFECSCRGGREFF